MKTNSIQQEILLVTNTTFSKRQYCEKEDPGNSQLSQEEKLEEACWNGLLNDLLPEIISTSNKQIYTWQIRQTKAFIEIELCTSPLRIGREYSIDPYYFFPSLCRN